MSEEFDSWKDSPSTKFERKPPIFVKLTLESYAIQLSGVHTFDNMAIIF